MFTLETPPTGLPFTTRSSLQALLKSRGAVLEPKSNGWIPMKDRTLVSNFLPPGEDSSIQGLALRNSPAVFPSQEADRNRDQNGDFSYSQKLFHIDDGNLYSIFSPLQGRSYGMKPSFLRKQKCTVQECHGRGRKIHRKGLKFHNFLPSESVTSEKDNDYRVNRWKVHSECKLREEHGTKQIMVSNWFQNVKQSQEDIPTVSNDCQTESINPNSFVDNLMSPKMETAASMCDFPVSSGSYPNIGVFADSEAQGVNTVRSSPESPDSGNKFSFLNNLLHSVSKSQAVVSGESSSKRHMEDVPNNCQKRRRKPHQTRRVVPYTKYLSLMEETEASPLDLSVHTSVVESSQSSEYQNQGSVDSEEQEVSRNLPNSLIESNLTRILSRDKEQTFNSPLTLNTTDGLNIFPNVPTYFYPMLQDQKPRLELFAGAEDSHGQNLHPMKIPTMNIVNQQSQKLGHLPAIVNSSSSSGTKSKARRKSQRSVIKQKLEDTFRQNGFLVKTKQVSDGEATFCKFRQLRKYTRYYLKSWQQHLPDEVHKMWKGFLPPKTVLPPVSGTSRTVSEDPT